MFPIADPAAESKWRCSAWLYSADVPSSLVAAIVVRSEAKPGIDAAGCLSIAVFIFLYDQNVVVAVTSWY